MFFTSKLRAVFATHGQGNIENEYVGKSELAQRESRRTLARCFFFPTVSRVHWTKKKKKQSKCPCGQCNLNLESSILNLKKGLYYKVGEAISCLGTPEHLADEEI